MKEKLRPDQSSAESKTNAQQPQTAEIWADLTQLAKSVVDEMNRVDELRAKAGGLTYQMDTTDQMIVTNESMPAMSVTISLSSISIDVHTRITIEGPVHFEEEARENLAVHIDDRGVSLRNENGVVLTVEQAVFYILRPFLHLGEPN